MKITAIDAWLVEVPLRGAFRNAHAVKSTLRSVEELVYPDLIKAAAPNRTDM